MDGLWDDVQQPLNFASRKPRAWLDEWQPTPFQSSYDRVYYMGASLNNGTPQTPPKMIIFSRKTHGCWVPPFQETLI